MPKEVSCHCVTLRRAARAVTGFYDGMLAESGLTLPQFSLLRALAREGPLPISMLAREVELDRTTLTRNLKPLESAGFLALGEGEDRRERVAELTRAGEAAIAAALPAWRKAQAAVERKLGAGRLRSLRAMLIELNEMVR